MPTYRDGKRWRYRFTINGKRYGGSTPINNNTQRVAEALERAHIDRVVARRYAGVMPTIKEFIVRFLAYQKQHTKPLTYNLHETILRLHVEPYVAKLPLDEFRRAEYDALASKWTCEPRTTNTRLGVVQRMLSLAAEWEIIPSAPKPKLLKIAKDHPRFLSEIEAAALLEAAAKYDETCPIEWRSMVLVGLRTGLRIGELRGLQWGDIEWSRGLLHVRRTDPGLKDLDANAPKGNRPRTVPLTPDTIGCLHELYARAKWREPKHWLWIGVRHHKGQRDRYRTRSESNCAVAIGKIAKLAGLDEEVTWHTLRHTYASWLVMRNVPLSVVQELLGHASIRQTERYAHLAPGFAQHAAVAALDIPLVAAPTRELGPGSEDA